MDFLLVAYNNTPAILTALPFAACAVGLVMIWWKYVRHIALLAISSIMVAECAIYMLLQWPPSWWPVWGRAIFRATQSYEGIVMFSLVTWLLIANKPYLVVLRELKKAAEDNGR